MTVDLNRYSYFRMIVSYRTLVYLETATFGTTVTVTGRMTSRKVTMAPPTWDTKQESEAWWSGCIDNAGNCLLYGGGKDGK